MSYLEEQKKQAASFRFRTQLFRLNRLSAYNAALIGSIEFQEQAEKLEQLEKAEKRNRLRMTNMVKQFQFSVCAEKSEKILKQILTGRK